MPVFKTLFAGSTKEHEIGSLFCAACDPPGGGAYRVRCHPQREGPAQMGQAEDCDVVSVCDGCGEPQ